jgi:hypothetical protein
MSEISIELERVVAAGGSFDDGQWVLFLDALERGDILVVERHPHGDWKVNAWVKAAILSGFRKGGLAEWPLPA